MKFDRAIEAFIKEFVSDLANKNVAIFAGAGMSKSVGYVDWPSLLSDIAAELGLSVDKEHDLISLAQYHVSHRGNRSGITKNTGGVFSSGRTVGDAQNPDALAYSGLLDHELRHAD
ncbi:hypothetical protein AB4156_40140 [Cupriavidus sp. 2MCAB6]|uniref:hypothetical protein n=1 Tax=Cupriavidus sp. 2MCAB6 TaxID=3232981 RepID=UPI003F92A764